MRPVTDAPPRPFAVNFALIVAGLRAVPSARRARRPVPAITLPPPPPP